MLRQTIHLSEWDWTIYAYYSVGHYYTDEIMDRLVSLGCRDRKLQRAYSNLSSGTVDTGLTYSNLLNRETVMVVGYASSGAELFNSLVHEMRHVEEHIARASHIEPYGEPVAYLCGELARQMYACIGHYLCDCCRKHIQKN
ncbi:MAG: hypothetical protein J6B83_03075 [Bacteroidaceae bacterium]|nr:hypothetical protein [Bacteroidaceae bacterium]